ncbi:rubrerythrin family protein [Mariprofundus sp. KV]|uniref:rubrerythrin family protein n=1 Tax=Mariprofundus sp. KV TaxID=2608715 RepID=UPI0015A210F9|nr:rubrerythrin family protein [Mariprofundus sp. KV]NWF35327.1 rubrerythrin [Mariprofundus sp. KV]
MEETVRRTTAWTLFIALLFALTGNAHIVLAAEKPAQQHRETLAVMQMLYGIEVRAAHRFQLFSDRASAEGYASIAHLFKAIAFSETIHADHFKALIESLGDKTATIDLSSIKVASTDDNLAYASTTELAEINSQYPRYIRRIAPEGHQQAQQYIEYAWEAEKHHRKLIEEMQSQTARLFNKVLATFGAAGGKRYYVNQTCGTTVTELPEDHCPVCHMPVATYIEVPKP